MFASDLVTLAILIVGLVGLSVLLWWAAHDSRRIEAELRELDEYERRQTQQGGEWYDP